MPIYEYRCPSCGCEFEQFQSISAEPHYTCPECGESANRRISASGFILKGAGFYVNDYKPAPSGEGEKKASTSTTSEGGSGEKTSDKKTSAKSSGGEDAA